MSAYTELRAALEPAVTPGEWMMSTDWNRAAVMQKEFPHRRVVCSGNQNNDGRWGREDWSGATWTDAKYIAAANPATIARLLAERDALEAEKYHLHRRLAAAEQERDQARSQHAQQAAIAAGVTDERSVLVRRLRELRERAIDNGTALSSIEEILEGK